jgi:molybdate transport system ATP-binding protein
VSQVLFQFQNANIAVGTSTIIRQLNWTVHTGETWAIVGASGSGKSTLAQAICGRARVASGEYRHCFRDLADVRFVPFREDSRLFSPDQFYYQQRYEFSQPDDCPTVREYLVANQPQAEAKLAEVIDRFALTPLLNQPLLQLSNGQTRRTRLARGILAQPALLILDEPFTGLDTASQQEWSATLADIQRAGPPLLIVTRKDRVPSWVAHTLDLSPAVSEHGNTETVAQKPHIVDADAPAVIEMRNVSVRHAGKTILDDIHWTVRRGERWAVLGPNGSGKTTLLSLICGDHPQVFANDVRVCGQRRGHGETIWDVKRRVGHVSPELHQYFPRMLPAGPAAATGFHDHLTPQPQSPEQQSILRRYFDRFQLTQLYDRPWWQLSTGQQRAILFVRAILKTPEILILDEPFQGMDLEQIQRFQHWLEHDLLPTQTLLFVTHNPEELPRQITHELRLLAGRVV